MSILVVDVGTSSARVAVVHDDATVSHERSRATLPATPAPGLVELDATALAAVVLELAGEVLGEHGDVEAVGIANQRTTTIVWDRSTGEPVAPGIGWQDLRTVGRCLELRDHGFTLAPNHSATKVEALLDAVDPERERDLCAGTPDSWLAWTLTGGALHVTDATNASVTGLATPTVTDWDDRVLEALRIPRRCLPRIVDSSGTLGAATALAGAPALAAMVGDQQASLVGQGCLTPGAAKLTLGTGGMLDVITGPSTLEGPLGEAGTFPLVARRHDGADVWAREGVMLTAGTNVEWLRDDLGLVPDAAASAAIAARCEDTGDVWFVPALLGLGTPLWDYGARGALLGLTRGTGAPQVVRAVLEGIAHRGTDLLEAAEADAGLRIEELRVDGGMSANPVVLQALADASGRAIEVSPQREATALGAGFLAGLATGTWADEAALAATWAPSQRVTPRRALDRDRWREAVARSGGWLGDLSAVSFR